MRCHPPPLCPQAIVDLPPEVAKMANSAVATSGGLLGERDRRLPAGTSIRCFAVEQQI